MITNQIRDEWFSVVGGRILSRLLCAGLAALALTIGSVSARSADLGVPVAEPKVPVSFLPVPGSFYLHAGVAGVFLDAGATMTLGGAPVPGATVSVKPQMTFVVEAGYFLTSNIAISVTGGWPPRAQVHPAGTIAAFGKLGIATYGPAAATIHYHFTGMGRFQPYIGFGPTFLVSFRTQDRLIRNLELRNSIGIAAQVGFDYMINERWGFFLDVKKAYLRTVTTGNIFGVPAKAKVKLDPLVIHTGVTFRF